MKSSDFRHVYRTVVTCLVLLLGVFIGLGAQEIPYIVYGPQDHDHGTDTFDVYTVWDMITVGDICYYLKDNTHVGLVISNSYYSVGYLMPDASTGSFPGPTNPESTFLTRLADSVVLGEVQIDAGFNWTKYNTETGQTNYPFITFDDFNFGISTSAIATSMDENHILVIFGEQYGDLYYASCMDLNYNELWGFSLADLNLPGYLINGRVFALDSQRFLLKIYSASTSYLITINSSGVIEHQSTVSDYIELHQTNIPGTFLVSRPTSTGIIELFKYVNNTLSPLLTISDAYLGRFKADADENTIVVMFENNNHVNELRKYDWEGNIIWSNPLPWRWINNESDNLAINEYGSIYLTLRDEYMHRYVLAKVLADGSDAFTANEDPTASPDIPGLSVFPNPFSAELNLNIKQERAGTFELSIYNLKGQLVRRYQNLQAKTGSPDWCWDTKDEHGQEVPNGVYLIRAKSPDGILQSKCIKIE